MPVKVEATLAIEVKGFNASTAVVAILLWIKNFLLVFITLMVYWLGEKLKLQILLLFPKK
jgi:hypothetical protein